MHVVLKRITLVFVAVLSLQGLCLAKEFHLRDGSIIDCESAWRRGDWIIVKVNRDTILEFDKTEVNVERSFPQKIERIKKVVRNKPAASFPAANKGNNSGAAAIRSSTEAPPAPSPQPAPLTAPVPPPMPTAAAKEVVQPEPDQTISSKPPQQLDQEEAQRRNREAAEMMQQAIQNQDAELMKKALELQQSAMPAHAAAASAISFKLTLIMLVFSLLILISMWVIFEKAGNSGWKSLIPIYNMYTFIEITQKPWWWLVMFFIPFIGTVFYLITMIALAKDFDRGALFGAGLCFLPMFFLPMLAFGGAQYRHA